MKAATPLEQRLQNERLHGSSGRSIQSASVGWGGEAGSIRRDRRVAFLTQGIPASSSVLEVGAGGGVFTADLTSRFSDVTAIDIAPEHLRLARERAPQARFREMDAHQLQFPAQSFDAVLGVSILHHLEAERALREWFRVLKPGGALRLSEPNLMNPQIFLQKNIPILKRMAGDSPDEYAFLSWRLADMLRQVGFSDVRVEPFEFLHPATPPALITVVLSIEGWLARTPLQQFAGSLLVSATRV
jgi:ubiquinone/menaquinone biosynthesis C-methylase UbiE